MLLAPILIVNAVVFRHLLADTESRVSATLAITAEEVARSIESDLNDMYRTVHELATNPYLTPFQFADSPVSRLRAIEELNRYVFASPFVWKLGMLMHGQTRILTDEGSFDAVRYFTTHYRPDGIDAADFVDLLLAAPAEQNSPPVRIQAGPQEWRRAMIVTVPIPVRSASPYATAVFVTDLERVEGVTRRVFVGVGGNTVVVDGEGRIVASRLPVAAADVADLFDLSYPAVESALVSRSAVGGEQLMTAQVVSPRTRWRYLTTLPVSELRDELRAVRQFAALSNIAIVLIGSFLAFAIATFAYRPIRHLVAKVQMSSGRSIEGWDEIGTIARVVEDISAANTRMRGEIGRAALALREHLLLGALKGQIGSVRTFNERGQEIGVTLAHRNLCVAVFVPKEPGASAGSDRLVTAVEAAYGDGVVGYPRQTVAAEHVPVIVAFQDMDDEALIAEHERVRRAVREATGIECSVGIGSRTSTIQRLPESYLGAVAAADIASVPSRSQPVVLSGEEEPAKIPADGYPQEAIDRLISAVRRGDEAQTAEGCAAIRDALRATALGPVEIRIVAFDLIAQLLRIIRREAESRPHLLDLVPDELVTARDATPARLLEIAEELASNAAVGFDAIKESHNNSLLDRIVAHIRERHARYDFSVATMAEHLDISQSYLSRFFRDQTGITVTEFVTQVRMEHARTFLRETSRSITEIALAVGYFDTSNFIKRFRAVEGRTPGEYRRLHGVPGSRLAVRCPERSAEPLGGQPLMKP